MAEYTHHLLAALLVSLRLVPALAFAGPFTLFRIPPMVRVLIALSLSLWLVSGRPEATVDVVARGESLLSLAVGELIVGIAIALSIQLAFAAILWAGRVIDIQAGFGLALLADPAMQGQMPLVGTVLAYAAGIVFFTMGAHYDLLALWAATLDTLPLGHGARHGEIAALLWLTGQLFSLALALVGVIMLALFLLDITIGFLSRTLPQMNALLLGFQVKAMAVLVTLPIAIGLSAGGLVRIVRLSLEGGPRLAGIGDA